MLGVCLGIFPSLSHLILKASIIRLCVVEKMRLREASPGYLSLLCVLRHLQSQSREAISYTADSWFSASSSDLRLLKHVDIFLSLSSLISQQHLSGWPDLLLDFHGPILLFCFLPLSGPLLAHLWVLAFPALSCLSLIQLHSPSGSGLPSWLWSPSACWWLASFEL